MLCKCFETCSFHAAEILPAPSAARSGGNEERKDRFFPAAMSGTVILRIFVVKSAGLCLGPLRAFRPEKFENDEKTIGTSPDAASGGGMDCVCDGPDDRFRTRRDGGSGQGAGCDAVGDLQCRGLQQIHPGRLSACCRHDARDRRRCRLSQRTGQLCRPDAGRFPTRTGRRADGRLGLLLRSRHAVPGRRLRRRGS